LCGQSSGIVTLSHGRVTHSDVISWFRLVVCSVCLVTAVCVEEDFGI